MLLAYLVAQAAPDFGLLAQYGILGLLVLALLFGKVVPGWVKERDEKRIEKLEAKIEKYEEMMVQVLTQLGKSNDLLTQLAKEEPR